MVSEIGKYRDEESRFCDRSSSGSLTSTRIGFSGLAWFTDAKTTILSLK